ncbi:MAG: hypothetical protein ABI333_28060 [bacterium]
MAKLSTLFCAVLGTVLASVPVALLAAPRPMNPSTAPGTPPTMSAPMARPASTGVAPAGNGSEPRDTPGPGDVVQSDELLYQPVRLEVRKIVWYEPGQRGLIEAHPLVMGLAAMALATVTLLFFFLRGVKRPKDGNL